MEQVNELRRYGLFDTKVPRYTSYPPANRFKPEVGARSQKDWLGRVSVDKPVSIYVHIPFCRRLCWFCACRTQGTKTLAPIRHYIEVVMEEIRTVARKSLPEGVQMARLHLGGGTPTLLDAGLMTGLLACIYENFAPTPDFEFSVEIDPTDAAPEVLKVLARYNMTRASIGVQDFDPEVQIAIGRSQSFEVTRDAITAVRENGVRSVNIDFLYGLPFQTTESLCRTLERINPLHPDRLALCGYAHVPHVSKRQFMIPEIGLPKAEQRFIMSQVAKNWLIKMGYHALGIDHFATPDDSLARAARIRTMRRNFQGYTDDPCDTLIGFGASAISKFDQGFLQNAVSTSAYTQRVRSSGYAAHKGIVLTSEGEFIAALVNDLMCYAALETSSVSKKFPTRKAELAQIIDYLLNTFSGILVKSEDGLQIEPQFSAAARLIAGHLDRALSGTQIHSLAV